MKNPISLVANKRFSDPRELQIDVTLPLVWIHGKVDGASERENRVMPFNNLGKFLKAIARKTKTIKAYDDSHYWVSGYIPIYFHMKTAKDRLKTKKIVQEALKESGGFMSFDEWLIQHNKKRTAIYQFNGTGSNIHGGLVSTDSIAFL